MGDYLLACLHACNMKRSEFATRVGVSRITVWQWLNNRHLITEPNLIKIEAQLPGFSLGFARNLIAAKKQEKKNKAVMTEFLSGDQ